MSWKDKVAKKVWGAVIGRGKTSPTITSVPLSPNLTTKRNIQDKVVKAVDEGTKKGLGGYKLSKEASQKLKQSSSKTKTEKSKELKDYSYKYDELVSKKKK
tara:strand:+ start:61 stop:363 length:303 start_codon:yes stop_codon:yes gene_type:complete